MNQKKKDLENLAPKRQLMLYAKVICNLEEGIQALNEQISGYLRRRERQGLIRARHGLCSRSIVLIRWLFTSVLQNINIPHLQWRQWVKMKSSGEGKCLAENKSGDIAWHLSWQGLSDGLAESGRGLG